MKELPKYDDIMLPLLKLTSDGKDYSIKDLRSALAEKFNLGAEELKIMLPSGTQTAFTNRCHWAKTYLAKAGLLENIKRGVFKITQEGTKLLQQNISKIDSNLLNQYASFRDFAQLTASSDKEEKSIQSSTPDETMYNAVELKNRDLADEVLQRVSECSPLFFEKLVISLLVKIGYGGSFEEASKVIGGSHDGGIDGVIKEDILGLDVIYIQAKRWKQNVGEPVIRDFLGALELNGTSKGVIITTAEFTKSALNVLKKTNRRVVLIDGNKLSRLMIEHNLGVSVVRTLEIKEIDNDFFSED